eukprot:Phypoly_transcript_15727.p2 GENE.Phypoly_transcript_15727~~Phypoly_transcript_15727.p2  ORF type:complete len:119 (+),score=6.58 Phypoly_transcript_15727:92-448(+)
MDFLKFYSAVTGPLSLFSAIICGIAVITSYIFPQQRKFPNIVLVWTCVGDFVFASCVSVMLLPGPISDLFISQLALHPQLCTLSLYSLWVMQQSASMLGLLLAFTLYVSLVKNIDITE